MVGRFHLLALHLPIGIMVLAAALVVWSKWKKTTDFDPVITFSVKIAAITAVLTAVCGWFLAQQGGYEEGALWWHQWSGIAAAALCCGCWWLLDTPYLKAAVMAATALVGTAGHFGGDLTHGTNYLFTKPKKAVALSAANPDDAAYMALIQPILDSKCVSCHNPSKAKGKLMMDSYEHLLKGGEKGLEISFGSADNSALYQRLILPAHEKEHMPPKGKAQLTPDEINIIAKWLDAGGNLDVKVREVI
jgi:mono/diheme cytochrome c family protein